MRVILENIGEGWFWSSTTIEVEVVDQVRMHSRLFYRVAFPEQLEVPEPGAPSDSGARGTSFTGAWLSPRWVGHEIQHDHPIVALLWLSRDVLESVKPPRDVDWSARVGCVQRD